jgi:hypothetical protein
LSPPAGLQIPADDQATGVPPAELPPSVRSRWAGQDSIKSPRPEAIVSGPFEKKPSNLQATNLFTVISE